MPSLIHITTIHPPHQRLWIQLWLIFIQPPTIHPPHQRLWIHPHHPTISSHHVNLFTRGSESFLTCHFLSVKQFISGSKFILVPHRSTFPTIHFFHKRLGIYFPSSNKSLSNNSSSSPEALNLFPLAITSLFQHFILLTRGSESTFLFIYLFIYSSSSPEALNQLPYLFIYLCTKYFQRNNNYNNNQLHLTRYWNKNHPHHKDSHPNGLQLILQFIPTAARSPFKPTTRPFC